jgi:hypothetical protein
VRAGEGKKIRRSEVKKLKAERKRFTVTGYRLPAKKITLFIRAVGIRSAFEAFILNF